VAVVDDAGKARLKTVTIGRDLGTSLEIISGLQPADAVVVNPPDSIADGTPVVVQQQPSQPSPPMQQPPAAAGH